jgi:hypothetical protein
MKRGDEGDGNCPMDEGDENHIPQREHDVYSHFPLLQSSPNPLANAQLLEVSGG